MEISNWLSLPLLYVLGLIGWALLNPLHVPVPSLLGTLIIVGGFRIAGYNLPLSPGPFAEIVQIILGFYVGNMVTKEALRQIRKLMVPGAIVMTWVVSLAFAGGALLSRVTFLDLLTSVLASTTGGLPEMTVIAVDTHADASVIIIMQLARIISVVVGFPLLLSILGNTTVANQQDHPGEEAQWSPKPPKIAGKTVLVSGLLAVMGGTIFLWLGIPAGGMVGSIAFVVLGTTMGYNVRISSPHILPFILVGVGIMAADNITPDVGDTLVSGALIMPILLSTTITMISSLLLAKVLSSTSKWDFLTCFMAAAPAGLTVMTALAVQYKRDPMPIFVLHMCRIIVLKTAIPLILMFFI